MKWQLNKNAPNQHMERASVPGTKRHRKYQTNGSVTIEASFAIPLFLFAVLCLIWLMEIQNIRISIVNAAQNAAKKAAESTAVVPVLNSVGLKSDIVDFVGKERIERSILDGGTSALSCWKSYVSPDTGEMKIVVEYRIRIPIPMFGNPSAELREEFRMNSWRGFPDMGMDAGDSEIVYITENGIVYHENYHCSYLQLSIRLVPYTQLYQMRNSYGGIYHKCETCFTGETMSGVYITENGNRYHSSLNCSGLKRTVRAVKRSETGGRGPCTRCSQ